jgi:hypothetical protein
MWRRKAVLGSLAIRKVFITSLKVAVCSAFVAGRGGQYGVVSVAMVRVAKIIDDFMVREFIDISLRVLFRLYLQCCLRLLDTNIFVVIRSNLRPGFLSFHLLKK